MLCLGRWIFHRAIGAKHAEVSGAGAQREPDGDLIGRVTEQRALPSGLILASVSSTILLNIPIYCCLTTRLPSFL